MFCINSKKRGKESKKDNKIDLKLDQHHNWLSHAVQIFAIVSQQYSGQSGRKNVTTFKIYVVTKAEKSPWKRIA